MVDGITVGGNRWHVFTLFDGCSRCCRKNRFRLMAKSKGKEAIVVLADTPYYESLESAMKIRKYVKQRNVSQLPKECAENHQ